MSGIQEWDGRVAVVTGGASGIGRGIASAFIARGAVVVIADIEETALDATAVEIGAVPVRTDVTDAASVQALATSTVERFGTVDILVNNAGVGPKAEYASLTLRDWKWILDVNLWGVIHGIDAFLPTLRANPRGGWIVNTASMSTFFFPPGYAPYVASKAAVDGLSRVLRSELAAEGALVGVTVLHPGAVRTNISDSLRTRPDDLAVNSGLFDFDIAQKLPEDARWATFEKVARSWFARSPRVISSHSRTSRCSWMSSGVSQRCATGCWHPNPRAECRRRRGQGRGGSTMVPEGSTTARRASLTTRSPGRGRSRGEAASRAPPSTRTEC